jgi:hypothetical protein
MNPIAEVVLREWFILSAVSDWSGFISPGQIGFGAQTS